MSFFENKGALEASCKTTTLEALAKTKEGQLLGANAGRGFEFKDGDILEIEEASKIIVRTVDKVLRKEKRQLLEFGAKINDRWTWIPVWAIRKSVPMANETNDLKEHNLYQDIIHEANDVERLRLIADNIYTVSVHEIEMEDNGKQYKSKVYTLEA